MVLRLWPESKRNVKLGTDLTFFQNHFRGQPMAHAWTPPEIGIRAPKARPKDFVPWFLGAPVVSDRARNVLASLLGGAEVLPLLDLHGKQYFAVNVTRVVDCLDRAASRVLYSRADPSHVLQVASYFFVESRVPEDPIFKVPEDPGAVFVSEGFARAVRHARLTGALFLDASRDVLPDILRGSLMDAYPQKAQH